MDDHDDDWAEVSEALAHAVVHTPGMLRALVERAPTDPIAQRVLLDFCDARDAVLRRRQAKPDDVQSPAAQHDREWDF